MAENFNWSNISSVGKSLGFNAGINANLNQGYSQSGQASGSVNSAQAYNNSMNESGSYAYSGTDAAAARAWSAQAADIAWLRDMYAMGAQMDFNREEAQKQRDWQAEMANTIYTRSVKNMKEAGINPILAYNMGLTGASVGTGATASLAGVPSAPLAQNFMDSWSASESYSHGSGSGYSEESGSGWGSGWSNSEEGIVTALQGLGALAGNALAGINAGQALEKLGANGKGIVKGVVSAVDNGIKNITGQKTFNDTWRNYNTNSGNGTKNGSKNPYQRNAG